MIIPQPDVEDFSFSDLPIPKNIAAHIMPMITKMIVPNVESKIEELSPSFKS